MGSGASQQKCAQQASKSKEIDEQIAHERRKAATEIKILLLGISGSGKSTIAKQMKILHLGGYSAAERKLFRNLIYTSILEALFTLNWNELGITEVEKETSNRILISGGCQISSSECYNINRQTFTKCNISYACDRLSAIHAAAGNERILRLHLLSVKQIINRYYASSLSDILSHFGSRFDEVVAENYSPSEMDILLCRTPTTGISEISFSYRSHEFRVIDVGGQRSERKKWIHCFDNVNSIIFVADLSGFDEVIKDDGVTNKMQETLRVFEEIASCVYFSATPIILLLNKIDVLRLKLNTTSLADYFPDYQGNNSFESSLQFFKSMFQETYYACNSGALYCNFTTATDTANVDKVFAASAEILVRASLEYAGLH